jgi:acyl carrier protein
LAGILGAVGQTAVELPTYAFQRERHWPRSSKFDSTGAPSALADSTAGPVERLDQDASRTHDSLGHLEEIGATSQASPQEPTLGGALAGRLEGLSVASRESLILAIVLSETAIVLGYDSPEALPSERTFKELGFDSAAGVELRNRLVAETGMFFPSTLVFDCPTPEDVARQLLAQAHAGAPEPVASLEAELTGLERRLTAIVPDRKVRAKLAAHLSRVLRMLEGEEDAGTDDDDVLSAATAEEVLELIDMELGSQKPNEDAHALG